MSRHTKMFSNIDDFKKANKDFSNYQIMHNVIRKDYELLLEITESYFNEKEKYNTLYRACLKGILSLIESDIYGLNKLDKYEGYSDKDCFVTKFKKTFKQISKTWEKPEVVTTYLDANFESLKAIKAKRDKLVHPKEINDIPNASQAELLEIKKVFEDYKKMLHTLMDNFFIGIEIKNLNVLF